MIILELLCSEDKFFTIVLPLSVPKIKNKSSRLLFSSKFILSRSILFDFKIVLKIFSIG